MPARLRAIATRALQRLLTAIVLPGALLAVGPLAMGLVAAVGGLTRLLALLTLMALLGTMRVLAVPVRSAMALATVAAGIRPASVAAMGMVTRLGTVRAMAVRFTMAPF